MRRLIEGFQRFRRVSYPDKRELFEKLAVAQHPHSMIITCADSRVVPEVFTDSEPGELFVCRNVGNIVPPYVQFTGGVSAAIEYAVAVLGVANIVVCGHSDCGAMKSTLNPEGIAELPAVSAWLRHAQVAKLRVEASGCCDDPVHKLGALTEENVIAQLDHLRSHPSVAARLAGGQLGLHGWVYDIETGTIKTYCAQRRQFIPLQEQAFDDGR